MTTTLEPLRLPDATAIFLREWPVPDGVARRGSLLLVHGLGEHSGRYSHVAERLAAMGLHVRGYDHRGHGESDGARGSVPHPEALLDDLRAVFDDLPARAEGDAAPPFLLGHSMGGAASPSRAARSSNTARRSSSSASGCGTDPRAPSDSPCPRWS